MRVVVLWLLVAVLLLSLPLTTSVSLKAHIPALASPVHYLEEGQEWNPIVLIIHGAAYCAQTWKDLGTLDYLAQRGFRAIAIDIPGYGPEKLSGHTKLDHHEQQDFIANFLRAIRFDPGSKLVIVEASMGGSVGNPFVVMHPELVAGLVTVSAVGLDQYQHQVTAATAKVPCLLYWGEKDHPDSQKAWLYEQVFTNHYKVIVPHGSHPCYLDDADMFHNTLEAFLVPHSKTSLPINAKWHIKVPYGDL